MGECRWQRNVHLWPWGPGSHNHSDGESRLEAIGSCQERQAGWQGVALPWWRAGTTEGWKTISKHSRIVRIDIDSMWSPTHSPCGSDALLPWRPDTGFLGMRMQVSTWEGEDIVISLCCLYVFIQSALCLHCTDGETETLRMAVTHSKSGPEFRSPFSQAAREKSPQAFP